ncbi:MAG TPA: ShlB/FhaC/HecB family hemolysin secretion/activation protein [Pseudomonadales bacterium]|nr:ShlB/FhaC/HecB family hemolysin secretion/activation protein [Pseudomonadales bacterium]
MNLLRPFSHTVICSLCLLLSAPHLVHADQQPAKEQLKFAIYEFNVRGNSLLEARDIENVLYPYVGTGKTIDDVESARAALEQRYRDAGYPTVLVNIPEQNATRGAITLEVIESRISSLTITGSEYFSPKDIREQVPALKEGGIMNSPAVSAQLGRLNAANPDRTVIPVLRPGKFPGTVEVELKVKDKVPANISLELNNRYTANTTQQRANINLHYGNLWQANHSIDLRYQWTPQDSSEVKVLVGTYVMPLTDNTKLAFYAVDSKSKFEPTGVLSVLGGGNIYGLRWIDLLPSSPTYFQNWTLGFDYKKFKDVINLDRETGVETPIKYLQFMMQYSGTWMGALDEEAQVEKHRTNMSVGLNWGMRGIFNNVDDFQSKADDSKPDYFYLRGSVEHNHLLPWELSANVKTEAQWSHQVLISNEQYSMGGDETVRGYLESDAMGENGGSMQFELRSMPFVKEQTWGLSNGYAFIFKDMGHVGVKNPLNGQEDAFTLASYGVGLNLEWFKQLKLSAAWAHPEKDSNNVKAGDNRVHFSIVWDF